MRGENMSKLLIVDDEQRIRSMIHKYAEFEGHTCKEAEDGMEAIKQCQTNTFDLIIMDVMMPNLDGFSACKKIKEEQDVPVIMLSARGEEYDKIHGFEIGVDDYVVKPFSPKELMMRIQAVLKRVQTVKPQDSSVFRYNALKVDFSARLVYIENERIEMTPKEYALLAYFIKNKDIALSREQLIQDVWGYDFIGDDRTLDTHIKLLRKCLREYSVMIVTVRGMGYRFETPIK